MIGRQRPARRPRRDPVPIGRRARWAASGVQGSEAQKARSQHATSQQITGTPVRIQQEQSMPIATPEAYAEMLDTAKARSFAYPAINVTSSQTLNAAIRGFAEAESDGIVQVSTGGAE